MAAPLAQCLRKLFSNSKTFPKILTVPLTNEGHNAKRWMSTKDMKKFYKTATITQADGWYEVNLDQRKLRTPSGNLFRVPNEALALAVATEWNSQKNIIKRHAMHLTSLCNTALDNPLQKTRETLIRSILHFLETDTVSFRISEPPEMRTLQQEHWEPLIDWVEQRYEIEVPIMEALAAFPDLKPDTVHTLKRFFESRSDWALFGYNYAVDTTKSLVLTLALMDKYITVERCVQLSRLEQDFQVERWGNVEWYHDLDLHDLRSRLSAAALFIHWSSETVTVKRKAMLPTSDAIV